MFSLNVPVPGQVARLAGDLHPQLVGFDQQREQHTLVVKRFDESALRASQPEVQLATLQQQLPQELTGTPAFEAAVRELDFFAEPARGDGPVVYLAVDSPGLQELHAELVDAYGAVDGLEGDDYVPHVTLARGGSVADAERVAEMGVESVSWTASELTIWDSRYREPVSRYSLPA
ncbi:MAG: 2'-5' RNA ligase family protein [Euryarchaeota archaeon]|nr:2'-5' RNA ligase family protein [Euryarchaeota archaeon]